MPTSATETTTVKLKLMIDKRDNKVLFAEAGKDFVDILFNVLYIPFATVIGLLDDAGMDGCTGNLYKSLENLDEAYLQPNQNKIELLKPFLKTSELLQPQACPQPVRRKLYNCGNNHHWVTNKKNSMCPACRHYSSGYAMDQEMSQLKTVQGGIVKRMVKYMVTDDLSVTPWSTISAISLLQGKGIGSLEFRIVEIGTDEVLELLKASLQSTAALTTVFLKDEAVTGGNGLEVLQRKGPMAPAKAVSTMANTPTSATETTTVKLKLMIDKRDNKVLFAEAGKDFVDILFNVLYMPFATVTGLLGDIGMDGCTGNLYKSLENLDNAYLQPNQNKVELLKPFLKISDLLQPQVCPQPEKRKLYGCRNNHRWVTNKENSICPVCSVYSMDRKMSQLETAQGGIVKKMVTYMVTDDLSVTPGSMISTVSLLQGKGIGSVEDRIVEIGTDEVLELLKASLQTTAALATVFLQDEIVIVGK